MHSLLQYFGEYFKSIFVFLDVDDTISGQCKVIEALMDDAESRIEINAKTYGKYNQTIFHHLVQSAHKDVIKFMLENVERFNIDIYVNDR